jgi:hypothetical protein
MKKCYAFLLAFLFVISTTRSQSPATNVNTVAISVNNGNLSHTIASHAEAVNTIQPNTNYTLTYNNTSNINIVDFTVASRSYVRFDNFDTVIIRRAANAWEPTGGNKQQIYCQGPALVDNLFYQIPFSPGYPTAGNQNFMEKVMKEGYINRGSDNVFNNDPNSDRTSNNIERVDFVYFDGLATEELSYAGFLIAERGGNDPFKIAAITAIDADGTPLAYGPIISVGTGSYGTTIASIPTYVLRKDPSDSELRPFSLVGLQNVRGIYLSFTNLGVTSMQRIYGYSLMANDVTATAGSQVVDYTNTAFFPRTTTTAAGGMDLAAAPGIFHTNQVLSATGLTLSAISAGCHSILTWDNDHQANPVQAVQYSEDGISFKELPFISIARIDTDNWEAKVALQGFYRIRSQTQRTMYTNTVRVEFDCDEAARVFPNPARDHVFIRNDNGNIREVSILTLTGQVVKHWNAVGSSRVQLDIGTLWPGMYLLQFTDRTGWKRSSLFQKL